MTDSHVNYSERDENGDLPPMNDDDARVAAAVENALALVRADRPAEVADKLRALGIKGVPNNCEACPMSRHIEAFLANHLPEASGRSVEVDGIYVTVECWNPATNLFDGKTRARLDPCFADFVRGFDGCHYPDLVDTEAL